VIADGPAPGRWTGLHGLAEAWRSILSAWEEFHTESVDEFRELDDQRVLVLHRWGGRGKTSGVEPGQMPAKGASLFHLRNGKVIRAVTYFRRKPSSPTSCLATRSARSSGASFDEPTRSARFGKPVCVGVAGTKQLRDLPLDVVLYPDHFHLAPIDKQIRRAGVSVEG
jgi:hypothetical protein